MSSCIVTIFFAMSPRDIVIFFVVLFSSEFIFISMVSCVSVIYSDMACCSEVISLDIVSCIVIYFVMASRSVLISLDSVSCTVVISFVMAFCIVVIFCAMVSRTVVIPFVVASCSVVTSLDSVSCIVVISLAMVSRTAVIPFVVASCSVVILLDAVAGAGGVSFGPASGLLGTAHVFTIAAATAALDVSLHTTAGTGTRGPVATHGSEAYRVQSRRSHPRDPQSVHAPQGKMHGLHGTGVAGAGGRGDGQVQPLAALPGYSRQAAVGRADLGIVGKHLHDKGQEQSRCGWRWPSAHLHGFGVFASVFSFGCLG